MGVGLGMEKIGMAPGMVRDETAGARPEGPWSSSSPTATGAGLSLINFMGTRGSPRSLQPSPSHNSMKSQLWLLQQQQCQGLEL